MAESSPRTITLDSNLLEPFEIGALLLAILAFPGPKEEDLCKKAAEALCGMQVRVTIAAENDIAGNWNTAYPNYAAIDESESRRRLKTFNRRLRDRMIASRMSLGFFQEGFVKRPAKLPALMQRHSLNDLSELVLSQSGQTYPENVEHRIWRKSLPVIHLAAAMQIAARALTPDDAEFGYPLDNGPLHQAVIQLAQLHEEIALSDQRFGQKRDELIRIRSGAEKP